MPEWVWHDGIVYLLSEINPPAIVKRERRTGTTSAINQLEPERVVTADIFTLSLNHGVAPTGGSYAYTVAPANSPDAISDRDPPTVLSNTRELQVVADPASSRWLVVFHAAGEIRLAPDLTLSALQPSLVIVARTTDSLRLHAAHPENRIRELDFTLNGDPFRLAVNHTPETAGRTEVLPIDRSSLAGR